MGRGKKAQDAKAVLFKRVVRGKTRYFSSNAVDSPK
jgi:hypothetical protein